MALAISICAICEGAIAAPVAICYACHAACARAAAEPRSGGDPEATATLTVRDFAALERLARLRLRPDDPATRALLEKLDRSRIVRVDAIAPDIATLGSRVVFSVDGGPPEARVLVLPTRHAAAGWTLPVTSHQGMALLGRAAGSVIVAVRHDGAPERLRLLSVVYQPEAAAAAAMAVRGSEGDGLVAAALPHTVAGSPGPSEPSGGAPIQQRPVLYRSMARAWPVRQR